MKRILCVLLAVMMLLTLAACNLGSDASGSKPSNIVNKTEPTPTIVGPDSANAVIDAVIKDVYEQDGIWYIVYSESTLQTFTEEYVSSLAVGGNLSTAYGDIAITAIDAMGTDSLMINGEYTFMKLDDGTYSLAQGLTPYVSKGAEHTRPVSANLLLTDASDYCSCTDLQTMFETHRNDAPQSISDEFLVGLTIENGVITVIIRIAF